MLLGFISLLLTATSSLISNICIETRFYDGKFSPCTRKEVEAPEDDESRESKDRKLLMESVIHQSFRRVLTGLNQNSCKKACDRINTEIPGYCHRLNIPEIDAVVRLNIITLFHLKLLNFFFQLGAGISLYLSDCFILRNWIVDFKLIRVPMMGRVMSHLFHMKVWSSSTGSFLLWQ